MSIHTEEIKYYECDMCQDITLCEPSEKIEQLITTSEAGTWHADEDFDNRHYCHKCWVRMQKELELADEKTDE